MPLAFPVPRYFVGGCRLRRLRSHLQPSLFVSSSVLMKVKEEDKLNSPLFFFEAGPCTNYGEESRASHQEWKPLGKAQQYRSSVRVCVFFVDFLSV